MEGTERTVALTKNLNAQQENLLRELSQIFPDLDEVDIVHACERQNWNEAEVSNYLFDRAVDERVQWKVRESKSSRRQKKKEDEAEKPSGKGGRERKRTYTKSGRRNRKFDKRNRNRGRRKKDKNKGGKMNRNDNPTQTGVLIPKQKSSAMTVSTSSWAARVKQPKPKPPVALRPSPNKKTHRLEASPSPHTTSSHHSPREKEQENNSNNNIVSNSQNVEVNNNNVTEAEIGVPPGLTHTVWAPVQTEVVDLNAESADLGEFGVAESEFPFDNQNYTNQTVKDLNKAPMYNESHEIHPFEEEDKEPIQLFTESNPNQLYSNSNSNDLITNNDLNPNEANNVPNSTPSNTSNKNDSPFGSEHREVASITSQYSRHMEPVKEQVYTNSSNERNEPNRDYRNSHEIAEFLPVAESGNEYQSEPRQGGSLHFNVPNVIEFDRNVEPQIPADSRSRPHSRSISGGLPFVGFNSGGVTMPAPVPFSQDNPHHDPHSHHATVTLPDETFHFENSGPNYIFGVDVPEEERPLKSDSPPRKPNQRHQMNEVKRSPNQIPLHIPRTRPIREQISHLDIQSRRDIRDLSRHPPHRRSEDRVNHHQPQMIDPNFMETYNETYERKNEIEDPRAPPIRSEALLQTEHRISSEYSDPNSFTSGKKEMNAKYENRGVVPPMYPAEEHQPTHMGNIYNPPATQQQNMYNQQQQPYVQHHQYKYKAPNPYDMNYEENNGYMPYGMEEKTHQEPDYTNQYSPTPSENVQYPYPTHSHGMQPQPPQQPPRQPPPPTNPSATGPDQHFKPHYVPQHYSTSTQSMTAATPTPLAYSPHTQYLTPATTTATVFPYGTHWPHMTSLATSRSSSTYPTVGFTAPSSAPVVYPNHAAHHYVRSY